MLGPGCCFVWSDAKNGVFLTAAVFRLLSDGAKLLTAFVRQRRLYRQQPENRCGKKYHHFCVTPLRNSPPVPAPKTSAPVRTAASLYTLPIQVMEGFREGIRGRDSRMEMDFGSNCGEAEKPHNKIYQLIGCGLILIEMSINMEDGVCREDFF